MEETMKKADKPLLSIVVPVYNGSAYIDELFAQFDGQDMTAVELVFIDDGSRDDSYEKLLAWQKKVDFTINVYHQENKGVSAARNLGVEMARGAYLTFVDVDDGIAPGYVSALLPYTKQEIDVLVFASRRVGEVFSREEIRKLTCTTLGKEEMLTRFWLDPTKLGVCNCLVKKNYLHDHDISSPVGYKYYEDYDLLLQIFAQTESVLVTDQVLYYYILREGSAMGRFSAERIRCLKLIKERGQWLESYAPIFAKTFRKWGVTRLYWSVLWQAALALPSYQEFKEFANLTHAREYLVKLKGYPDKLLSVSTAVFLHSRRGYYLAARLMGRAKSKVEPADLQDIRRQLPEETFY